MSLSWPTVKLADVTSKVGSGATPRGGSDAYKGSGVPLLRSMNVHFDGVRDDGLVYLDEAQAKSLEGVTVRANDVLLNITGASIGRVAVAPERFDGARVNQHVCIIRTKEALDAHFLKLFLNSPSQQSLIMAEESGATRQALTKEKILNFEVPLPPLAEQKRLVVKLAGLTARSRRAKESLDALPPLLDKLRQSILAAAFRGDLTADWRANSPDVESADKLLARIRSERRARWREEELSRGRPGSKYREATETVPEEAKSTLPEGWLWVTAAECAWDIAVGHVGPMKHRYVAKGVPFLRSQNVRENRFDAAGLLYIDDAFHSELKKSALRPGDLVVVRTGAPGTACVIPSELETANCADLVICRLVPSVSPELLCYFVNSQHAKSQVLDAQVGVAQQHFNVAAMRRLAIPLVPVAEQHQLLRRIEASFAAVARIEVALEDARGLSASSEAAVLAAAFRGELLPQSPRESTRTGNAELDPGGSQRKPMKFLRS